MLWIWDDCGHNHRMKKYNFNEYELWFSFRSLQVLACADRNGFKRYVKRVWRSAVANDFIEWKQEKIYLSRREGTRNVNRVTEIFDLDTSYLIMAEYRKNVPPNFRDILNRFEELKNQNKKEYANRLRDGLKGRGMLCDYMDERVFSDNELLELLLSFKGKRKEERKRLILDYRNGSFKIVPEVVVMYDKNKKWSPLDGFRSTAR